MLLEIAFVRVRMPSSPSGFSFSWSSVSTGRSSTLSSPRSARKWVNVMPQLLSRSVSSLTHSFSEYEKLAQSLWLQCICEYDVAEVDSSTPRATAP